MKFTTPQPTYTLPPITGRVGTSQVPCSDYVTIHLVHGTRPTQAIAIMNSDGTFDCWYSKQKDVYWANEVERWEA